MSSSELLTPFKHHNFNIVPPSVFFILLPKILFPFITVFTLYIFILRHILYNLLEMWHMGSEFIGSLEVHVFEICSLSWEESSVSEMSALRAEGLL